MEKHSRWAQAAPNDPDPPRRAEQGIKVAEREFSFTPAHFAIQEGQAVNIELLDAGGMFHTFTLLGGPSFNLQANAGQSISGALTITRPGTYQFVCSVAGHAQAHARHDHRPPLRCEFQEE